MSKYIVIFEKGNDTDKKIIPAFSFFELCAQIKKLEINGWIMSKIERIKQANNE